MDILDEVLQGDFKLDKTRLDTDFTVPEFLDRLNGRLRNPISQAVLYNHFRAFDIAPITYGRYDISSLYLIFAWITRSGSLGINSKKDFMVKVGRSIVTQVDADKKIAIQKWIATETNTINI